MSRSPWNGENNRRAVLGVAGYLRRRIVGTIEEFVFREYESGYGVDLLRNKLFVARIQSSPPADTIIHMKPDGPWGGIWEDAPLHPYGPSKPIGINITCHQFGFRNYRAWVYMAEKYHQRAVLDYQEREKDPANWLRHYLRRVTA